MRFSLIFFLFLLGLLLTEEKKERNGQKKNKGGKKKGEYIIFIFVSVQSVCVRSKHFNFICYFDLVRNFPNNSFAAERSVYIFWLSYSQSSIQYNFLSDVLGFIGLSSTVGPVTSGAKGIDYRLFCSSLSCFFIISLFFFLDSKGKPSCPNPMSVEDLEKGLNATCPGGVLASVNIIGVNETCRGITHDLFVQVTHFFFLHKRSLLTFWAL